MRRALHIFLAILSLLLLSPIILLAAFLSLLSTGQSPLYLQERIGKHAVPFTMYKIRTMKDEAVTKAGRLLRSTKLDELPQLYNILIGDMNFVGPRPDLPGFADRLEGEDTIILDVRPGLTGPASIYFRNEEALLAKQQNPEQYNESVIWPKKVNINKKYVQERTLAKDFYYLLVTIYVICNPRSGYLLHPLPEKKSSMSPKP